VKGDFNVVSVLKAINDAGFSASVKKINYFNLRKTHLSLDDWVLERKKQIKYKHQCVYNTNCIMMVLSLTLPF